MKTLISILLILITTSVKAQTRLGFSRDSVFTLLAMDGVTKEEVSDLVDSLVHTVVVDHAGRLYAYQFDMLTGKCITYSTSFPTDRLQDIKDDLNHRKTLFAHNTWRDEERGIVEMIRLIEEEGFFVVRFEIAE